MISLLLSNRDQTDDSLDTRNTRDDDGAQYMTGLWADGAFDAIQNISPQVIL